MSKPSSSMKIWLVLMAVMIMLAGCGDMLQGGDNGGGKDRNPPAADTGNGNTAKMQSLEEAESVPTRSINGKSYVDLQEFTSKLGFNNRKDENGVTYLIGDTDVEYRVTVDSIQAEKEGDPFTLADPLVMADNKPYISTTSLVDLFGDAMQYEFSANGDQLRLFPVAANELRIQNKEADSILDFAEDPAAGDDGDLEAWTPLDDPESQPTLKQGQVDNLIRTARKYMGVEYDFGAKPYGTSRKFDCSSFVQFVYGKYGVDLPRVARNQAKRGKAVSRKMLKKGDLLFFYWPGRFKSNNIVGHVGIYIGNNKMIHSSPIPKDGVQISNINDSRWKRTFLKARRFVD